jgi:hypothetical protein
VADSIDIRLRLQNARRFSSDAKRGAKDIDRIGDAADRTKRDAREAGTALRGIGAAGRRGFSGIGRIIGAAGGIYALSRGIRSVAEEYTEAARAGAQTDAVIKSTRGVAGLTRTEVEGLAAALSRKAAIDDELIQSGANVLLTFKQIRNEAGQGNAIFDRATAAALDLSVAFGKDMRSSSVLVGKALNDPIKGVTALTRVGVDFTQQQKDQIQALVDSGDQLGAQKIIIKELESQVKGSAKAQAQPMDRLKVGWNNIEESIGRLAAPSVNRGIAKAADLVSDLEESLLPIWEKGDLGFEEKMERSLPIVERAFSKAKVGEGLAKAVEAGVPIVADAFAASSPRAAKAFVTGFKNAGPWGQLVTVGFLASRMGAFGAVGPIMGRRFANHFAPVAVDQAVAGTTGKLKGSARGGRLAGGFTSAGRLSATAFGLGFVSALGAEVFEEANIAIDDWARDQFGPAGSVYSDIKNFIGSNYPEGLAGGPFIREAFGDRGPPQPPPPMADIPDFRPPPVRRPRGRSGPPRGRGSARTQALPVRAMGSWAGGDRPIVIELHNAIELDGEVVAKNTAKHVRRARLAK